MMVGVRGFEPPTFRFHWLYQAAAAKADALPSCAIPRNAPPPARGGARSTLLEGSSGHIEIRENFLPL
jgi:hypothetical protein